ncbi:MAG: hypothetical protein QOJ64_2067 [Acidobacteriota bacterium]|jgi:hypothetical protein|nr:hypothetical protein [Acidobacteriota bacterium]
MIELYFLIIRIPRMMSQLARERNRSAVGWSLAAIAAWIGSELLVLFVYSVIYEIGVAQWGWSVEAPRGLLFLMYLFALCAAIMGPTVMRRILRSMPTTEQLPPPPPPPQF